MQPTTDRRVELVDLNEAVTRARHDVDEARRSRAAAAVARAEAERAKAAEEAFARRLVESGPKRDAEQRHRLKKAVLQAELRRAEAERAQPETTAHVLINVLAGDDAAYQSRDPKEICADLARLERGRSE